MGTVCDTCNVNRQHAQFLHSCFNLIIVSSTCFEHPSVHPQEDWYIRVLWYFFHAEITIKYVLNILHSDQSYRLLLQF